MASTITDSSPPSLRPWLLGVVISMAVLAVLLTSLRLLSRRLLQQKLWHDDYLILVSTTTNLLCAGLILALRADGLGQSSAPATMPSSSAARIPPDMSKLILATEVAYAWTLCLTKLSVLITYYRVFDDLSRAAKAVLGALAGFVVVWSCTSTLLFVFTCSPVQKLWAPDTPGQCMYIVGRWVANAASAILTDVAILLLAVTQLMRMTLTRLDKIGVTVIFMQGFFVLFASAYRFALLFSYHPANALYTMAPTIGWLEIELAATIVAANLPILKPLLLRVLLSFGYRGSYQEQQQQSQSTFFSGMSGRSGKKLSADSGPSAVAGPFVASPKDMWDWNQCVEGNVRPVALAKNQHRATASRGGESDMIDVPLYGITVTKDFRRGSVVETNLQ